MHTFRTLAMNACLISHFYISDAGPHTYICCPNLESISTSTLNFAYACAHVGRFLRNFAYKCTHMRRLLEREWIAWKLPYSTGGGGAHCFYFIWILCFYFIWILIFLPLTVSISYPSPPSFHNSDSSSSFNVHVCVRDLWTILINSNRI